MLSGGEMLNLHDLLFAATVWQHVLLLIAALRCHKAP